MNVSKGTYNVVRSVVVTTLVLVVALFAMLYLLLLLPSVQQRLCKEGEKALSEYLNTTVNIGSVSITPFNQLELNDVLVNDQQGDSLLTVGKLGAGISLKELIADRRIVITYGEIIALNGHVTRPDKDSPTNIQFIIDAFKPKEEKSSKPFDVQVKTVAVRKSSLTYDVLDQPAKLGRFDPNHLAVKNLRADLSLPQLKNDDFDIRVKRLSFDEHSGLSLKHLSTNVHVTDNALDVTDIKVQFPSSDIRLDDIHLEYSSLKNLGSELAQMPLSVSTSGSTVTPADFAVFVPQLKKFNTPLRLTTTVMKNGSRIEVPNLNLNSTDGTLSLNTHGSFTLPTKGGYQAIDLDHIDLKASAATMSQLADLMPGLSPQARKLIGHCGNLGVDGKVYVKPNNLAINGAIKTSLGDADLNGTMSKQQGLTHVAGHIKTDGLHLGTLLDKRDLIDQVALDTQVDLVLNGNDVSGHLEGLIPFVDFKGTRYHDIKADVDKQGRDFKGRLAMNDPNGRIVVEGNAVIDGKNSVYELEMSTDGVNLARLGLLDKFPNHHLAAKASASFWGNSLDNATGHVEVNDLTFVDNNDKGVRIKHLELNADNDGYEKVIDINTDHVTGYIKGQYDFKTIVPTFKHMLASTFPQYFGDYANYGHNGYPNDVEFKMVVNPDDELNEMLNLPVYPFFTYTVEGGMSETDTTFNVVLDAPFMKHGSKIITNTRLTAGLDNVSNKVMLALNSGYPIKNGKVIGLKLNATGQNDVIDTHLDWQVEDDILANNDSTVKVDPHFHGNFDMGAQLGRGDDGKLKALIDIKPSRMVVNDTIWDIEKGHIAIDNGTILVQNVAGGHGNQFIHIDGKVSSDPDDELCLTLNDVNLDYVFEMLNIDHVDFGGRATSKVYASALLSGAPRLHTPSLFIQDISYNGAVMGDLDIEADFDSGTQGVMVKGDINQPNGRRSTLDGGIFIADDSLYIEFDTDHANVAFLQPYMEAFTKEVEGEMSGKATLFGNFHTINLGGDIVADSIRFLLDFVNCYYTASNVPIHIVPDTITFNEIPIHDREGHEAKLGGWLIHDAFHKPVFNFAITDAKDFLCYDTNPSINPDWYGTVYGNGSCFVDGGPGIVTVQVNMVSAPRSKFTYVLSDSKQADNYNFITFRDREAKPEPVQEATTPLMIIQQMKQAKLAEVKKEEESEPSVYLIDLQGDITPDLAMTVIMDPVGGDKIKATGNGHLRMTYNNNGELQTFGKYTLDKGTYNFTLQDIILKDFTIRDGSSISFQGDPYAAMLDLEAVYSVNANIRDLDESFDDDPDLKRTNVPVHALLRAKGIISQPDISFDLEFPSLTTDAYQKVKSIINTDEMMNRQIIYLLALNRFYTPDYMNQNELISSVASSTIAGQLSNILGKMTDNLSIAPNFRTEKGDFSDMEVDVALSSQLLNNRLLLNGNFGYRDNTYNTSNTNFIGDFDIEYLLNSKGTFRLKAYNHFNDQNYYLRNALTTQGVGIVWKHDFDHMMRKGKKTVQVGTDSIPSIPRREPSPATPRDSSVRQPVPMVTLRSSSQSHVPSTAQ
jgi:hypothetical protein